MLSSNVIVKSRPQLSNVNVFCSVGLTLINEEQY